MGSSPALRCLALAFGLAALLAPTTILALDEDAPIDLAPVEKRAAKQEQALEVSNTKPADTPAPTALATPTQAPTAAPTPVPTPKPKPVAKAAVKVLSLDQALDSDGLVLTLRADGPLMGQVSSLRSPDRVLVRLPGTVLAGGKRSLELGQGAAVRARLAQNRGEVWLVVDLLEPVAFKALPGLKNAFGLRLATGAAKPIPTQRPTPPSTATLPKVQLMVFDRNVLFQGKQYDRFPCANLIYDKADAFPLEREFSTILVFSQGYGAFVGNLRVVGPDGQVLDQTREPFAFNLFNALTDHSFEHTWKLRFEKKGWHRVILTLNGEDALEHKVYVGHNDDRP